MAGIIGGMHHRRHLYRRHPHELLARGGLRGAGDGHRLCHHAHRLFPERLLLWQSRPACLPGA